LSLVELVPWNLCFSALQRDFEPMTGAMWRDATRYQLNVAVDKAPTVGQVHRPRPLSLAYVGQPLPVYWVEKYSTINSAGIEDFYSRVRFHVADVRQLLLYTSSSTNAAVILLQSMEHRLLTDVNSYRLCPSVCVAPPYTAWLGIQALIYLLPTALVRKVTQSPPSVRPSFSTLTLNRVTLTFFACIWVMTIVIMELNVKVRGQGY